MPTTSAAASNIRTSDRKLIDSAVYLASLASELKEIDPKLDKLRAITASWDQKTPLSADNVHNLQKLIADLKDYLINRDPLRSFTPETLDTRLSDELNGRRRKLVSFGPLLAACVALSMVTALLPLGISRQNQRFIAIATFLVSLVTINCWLYITSFRNFKPELRSVFMYLCTVSIIVGMHFVDYLIAGWLQITDRPLFRYGGATEVPALAIIVLYVGLLKYARILKIPVGRIGMKVTGGTIAILSSATAISLLRGLPDKFYFGLSLASILTVGYFALLGAMVARKILGNVTASYSKSLRLLYIFELMLPVVAVVFGGAVIWLGSLQVGALSLLLAACGTPTMILFMYSGYSFKKATSR